jgi:hypothetical protein
LRAAGVRASSSPRSVTEPPNSPAVEDPENIDLLIKNGLKVIEMRKRFLQGMTFEVTFRGVANVRWR